MERAKGLLQRADASGQGPGQTRGGGAHGGLGVGGDEVRDGLGAGEVDAAMEEGAAGELTGPGGADGGVLQGAGEQQAQEAGAAMGLELDDVLAGEGMRRAEEQEQPLVEHGAGGIDEGGEIGVPGGGRDGHAGREQPAHLEGGGAGEAEDADGASGGSGGERGEGGGRGAHASDERRPPAGNGGTTGRRARRGTGSSRRRNRCRTRCHCHRPVHHGVGSR